MQAYAIPFKLVLKNNWGTHHKWWGKMEPSFSYVGSMSLLNMALVCIRVGLGTSHLFTLPSWVWIILFDLSYAHCLVTMTSDPLMSNTANSTVVPFICSREVGLCKYQPSSISHTILIHNKTSCSSVSCR